ncbi:MAG TPA: tetratricopeptide repeat protein [Anaerolineae bacterium]|nr:tetratricopeptide repeat protein [Anaerolineae bacterium]
MRLKLTTFVLLLLFSLLSACSSDPLAAARKLADAGDRPEAIAAYDAVLTEASDLSAEQLATAHYERGMLYLGMAEFIDLGNNDSARDDLEAALAGESADLPIIPALATLARQYADEEQWENVVAVADNALAVEPDNAALLNARGQAHLELRNFEQAIADLKASLQGEVNAASAETSGFLGLYDAYFRLGRAMLDIGEYEEALTSFSEAINNASGNADKAAAQAERGFTHSEMNEPDQALADLDQAIALDPELAIAYAYRSYAYSAQENYDAAVADANKAVTLGDDLSSGTRSAIFHAKAFANLQVGDYQAALADATESINLEGVDAPNAARTYGLRSRINYNLNDYQAAVDDASKAIEVGASDITALDGFYYRRGLANYALAEYTTALEDVEAAFEVGGATFARYELQGDIFNALGDTDAAVTSYQAAIQLAPENAWLHNYLADIYYDAEDYASAETEYRAALRLDDQNDLFHSNLGYALRQQERFDEAIEAFSAALDLFPDDAWHWYARGYAYYLNFDDASAIADMEQAIALGADDDALVERANEILGELR